MNIVNQLFNLEKRVIIVAGGAGQIGFSFCTILADAGATVIIADLDLEMAENKIAQIIRFGNKGKATCHKTRCK